MDIETRPQKSAPATMGTVEAVGAVEAASVVVPMDAEETASSETMVDEVEAIRMADAAKAAAVDGWIDRVGWRARYKTLFKLTSGCGRTLID